MAGERATSPLDEAERAKLLAEIKKRDKEFSQLLEDTRKRLEEKVKALEEHQTREITVYHIGKVYDMSYTRAYKLLEALVKAGLYKPKSGQKQTTYTPTDTYAPLES